MVRYDDGTSESVTWPYRISEINISDPISSKSVLQLLLIFVHRNFDEQRMPVQNSLYIQFSSISLTYYSDSGKKITELQCEKWSYVYFFIELFEKIV